MASNSERQSLVLCRRGVVSSCGVVGEDTPILKGSKCTSLGLKSLEIATKFSVIDDER